MTNLFCGAEDEITAKVSEFREERAAILEFDGGIPRESAEAMAFHASEAYRHECEVRSMVALFRTKGRGAVTERLIGIEKARGADSAAKLRTDALSMLKQMALSR